MSGLEPQQMFLGSFFPLLWNNRGFPPDRIPTPQGRSFSSRWLEVRYGDLRRFSTGKLFSGFRLTAPAAKEQTYSTSSDRFPCRQGPRFFRCLSFAFLIQDALTSPSA